MAPRMFKLRRGNIAVLSAFLLIVMLAMLAFSVDVGWMSVQRTNVQRAADAASLAAVDILGQDDVTLEDIVAVANQYLVANGISGTVTGTSSSGSSSSSPGNSGNSNSQSNSSPNGNAYGRGGESTESTTSIFGNSNINSVVEVGTWDTTDRTFTLSDLEEANAVKITSEVNNVQTFFGHVLGTSQFNTAASSVSTGGKKSTPEDILLVMDCSGSMDSNNRMTYTIAAALELANQVSEDDRLGLVVYTWEDKKVKTGRLEIQLNFQPQPTIARIPQLRAGHYTSGTNIAGGMRVALDEFRTNPRTGPNRNDVYTKVMVLLTDGAANLSESPGRDPWSSIDYYATLARDESVVIHAITLGDNESADAMQRTATTTGGTYTHIEDGDYSGLVNLFKKLGSGTGKPTLVQ